MTTRTRTRALSTTGPRSLGRGLAATGAAAVLALGLGACSETTGDEDGASVEEVQQEGADAEAAAGDGAAATGEYAYDGVYDQGFYEEQDTYVGQEVTLSADVGEIISDTAFTIAGGDVDDFLVVDSSSTSGLEPDQAVQVSGTVRETFDVVEVEEDLGIELEDSLYADWVGKNYLVASAVDTGVSG